ncbi:MAG: hypothetical protein ACOCSE_02555 [Chitinivibrionales bacterium]
MNKKEIEHKTRVRIFTHTFRITGEITLLPNARLTDYITTAKNFFAVTNAVIKDISGKKLTETEFTNIHRDHVELIMPAGDSD